MWEKIVEPEIPVTKENARSGLACYPGRTGGFCYSRTRWAGVGRVAPPFFLTRMDNGPTEIAALKGTFYEVILVRFRHHTWVNMGQFLERVKIAVRQKLKWDRNLDDYF